MYISVVALIPNLLLGHVFVGFEIAPDELGGSASRTTVETEGAEGAAEVEAEEEDEEASMLPMP